MNWLRDWRGRGVIRPGPAGLLVAYLVVQLALLWSAVAFGGPLREALSFTILATGGTVFSTAVAIRRPRPAVAWWFLAAASLALIVMFAAILTTYGLDPDRSIGSMIPLVLSTIPLPLLAVGLGLLSRAVARPGSVDTLDAGMVAVAGFLLLWLLVIRPGFSGGAGSGAIAVVLPVSIFLVFCIAVKICLGGGLRDPATRVLLLGVALVLMLTVETSKATVGAGQFETTTLSSLLCASFGLLVGCVGLWPSLLRERRPGPAATTDLTSGRLALFGALALVPFAVWGWEASRSVRPAGGPVGAAVSVVASAVFVILVVARLSLLARLAQERAQDLQRQSARQAELSRQLAFQASHDPLTGLANRAVLTDRMERDRTRPPRPDGLLMLDLDGFKQVNDTYGHPVGDELLIQVAVRLRTATPAGATVARLGGDEFAILIEDADAEVALRIAERVVDALRATVDIAGHELRVTTSIGVIGLPAVGHRTSAEALRDADNALYAAKAAGKNRAILW